MKKYLAQFLTKHLFRWVSEEDIFTGNRIIMHRGRPMDDEQVSIVASQAEMIRDTYLWKVLKDEVGYVSQEMFIKAKDYDETLSARLLLRAIEILDKRLASLSELAKKKE